MYLGSLAKLVAKSSEHLALFESFFLISFVFTFIQTGTERSLYLYVTFFSTCCLLHGF